MRPDDPLLSEVSLLGAILAEPEAVHDARELVSPETFSAGRNRRIFEALCRLADRGVLPDVTELAAELRDRGDLEDAGGLPYLAQLVDAVPSAAGLESYAERLRNEHLRRRLGQLGRKMADAAEDRPSSEVRDLLGDVERELVALSEGADRGDGVLAADLVMDTLDRIERRQLGEAVDTGLPTGFGQLDRMTGGMRDGQMVVLAGRPSMGKTTVAVQAAAHAALDEGEPVMFFSLEMAREELIERLFALEAQVPVRRLRGGGGTLSDDEYRRLSRAAGRLKKVQGKQTLLHLDDSPNLTLQDLRARTRRFQRRHGLGLVVLDYLQLMEGPAGRENRQQEVSHLSRGLKLLAKELQVPVLALSQLSRAPEHRSQGRPRLADLRESGAIEQDADVVLFIYRREEYLDPSSEAYSRAEGKAELIIGKQRNGPTDSVPLRFRKSIPAFDSVLAVDEEAA